MVTDSEFKKHRDDLLSPYPGAIPWVAPDNFPATVPAPLSESNSDAAWEEWLEEDSKPMELYDFPITHYRGEK